MRPTCTYCARKHLAQASILVNEARMGYPEHLWLAVGHMAEAAEELIGTYPDMANLIRMHRKQLEMSPPAGTITSEGAGPGVVVGYAVPFMDLIAAVGKLSAANTYPIAQAHADGTPLEITPEMLARRVTNFDRVGPEKLDQVVGRTSQVDQFAPEPPPGHLLGGVKFPEVSAALRVPDAFPSSAAPVPMAPPAPPISEAQQRANLDALIEESKLLPRPDEPGHKEAVDAFQKRAQAMNKAGLLASITKLTQEAAIAAAVAEGLTPEQARAKVMTPAPVGPPGNGPCLTCGDKDQLTRLAMSLHLEDIKARDYQYPREPGPGLRPGPGPKPRLMILTTLANFNPAYSLTSVILEQAHAAVLVGYRVFLLVHRGCDMSQCPPMPPEITVLTIVPTTSWKEDILDEDAVQMYVAAMNEWVQVLAPPRPPGEPSNWARNPDSGVYLDHSKPDVVPVLHIITHDLLFQSWFVSFAKAIAIFANTSPYEKRLRWYHMAHSSVGARPYVMDPHTTVRGNDDEHERHAARARWYRCTLPPGHHLIALNYADVPHLLAYYDLNHAPGPNPAESYAVFAAGLARTHTLLNPRDIRPFLRMTQIASMLTTRYGLHLADVTMIYPLSAERAQDKGVDKVLAVFGALKKLGLSVKLLLITAHANGESAKPIISRIKEQTVSQGLTFDGQLRDVEPNERYVADSSYIGVTQNHRIVYVAPEQVPVRDPDVILTCDALPATAGPGLDADTVRSLWQVANLFVFPTISEAGSLVLMEAALAGCTLVLNQSLPALADYIPADLAIWVPWGSLKGPAQVVDVSALAEQIVARMHNDISMATRRAMFRNHSLEAYGAALKAILEPETEPADSTTDAGMDDHVAVMNLNVEVSAAAAVEQVQRVAENFAATTAGPSPDSIEGGRQSVVGEDGTPWRMVNINRVRYDNLFGERKVALKDIMTIRELADIVGIQGNIEGTVASEDSDPRAWHWVDEYTDYQIMDENGARWFRIRPKEPKSIGRLPELPPGWNEPHPPFPGDTP